MHVKKGDNVIVIAGKDKGKKGAVVRSMPKQNKVIVEGVHIAKRHQRSRKQGSKGQILEIPSPIDASNVKKV